MELESVNTIRQRYLDLLSQDKKYNHVLSTLAAKKKTEPIFDIEPLDAESDLTYASEQRQMSEILLDMHAVNNGIMELKNKIQDTVTTVDNTIASILDTAKKQQEQVRDLRVICGKNSAYSSVIPVYASAFPELDAEVINDTTFGAMVVNSERIPYDIISLSGNGYSGNFFVYTDKGFENEWLDRSDVSYLMDANDVTVYEYSRLCTQDKKEAISGIVNYDDKEVECVITMMTRTAVCKMLLKSLDFGLAVRKLEVSSDNIIWKTIISDDMYINQKDLNYQQSDYAYGSSILCFPYSYYIRITLANNMPTNDMIAIQEDNGSIRKVNAYRKRISLQEIQLYNSEYNDTTIESDNVLDDSSVDKISLFAAEYIPDHFPEADYISYWLIVNGQEYPIVPVNTGRSGIAMIKYADENYSVNDNTSLIHETIKSIRLKILIRSYNKTETPYVSNLKLCLGKNTGNIYV